MSFKVALKTALGMSFISMLGMELVNELNRLDSHWRSFVDLVGSSNYVNFWIYNSTSLQLLEIKKI